MEALKKNKHAVIVIGIILILALAGWFITRGGGNDNADESDKDSILPNAEVIPTVDPSVKVSLEADALNQEVTITVEDLPEGTDSIEYEFTYDSFPDGSTKPKAEGLIGELDIENDVASKQITLGTCSSGVCRYHEGVKLVNVYLKFNGTYGAQIFEDEFEL